MMKMTCECGKVLHGDECAFHNDNYKDVLLFLCPYCGQKTTAFVHLAQEETHSALEIMPGLAFSPERLEPSLPERAKEFFKMMIKKNDSASDARLRPS
jgi:hypothetical protein